MPAILFSPEAKKDLHDIKKYISEELESPMAAQNTVSKIIKAIRNLQDFPSSGTPLSSIIDIETQYRFIVSGNYLVFYKEDTPAVRIIRILYGKRDYLNILFS